MSGRIEANSIIQGDNIEIMSQLLEDDWAGKINLIYIDPPFYSQNNYASYNDKWGSIEEYLEYMKPRIELMRELLSDNGTFYLHCDWHASHYLKVMCDELFGYDNFRNEIIWSYRRKTKNHNDFQRTHNTIIRYSQTDNYVFNQLYEPRSPETDRRYRGKKLKQILSDKGTWLVRATEEESVGTPMLDVWNIGYVRGSSKERGEAEAFSTQKPEALLERIIKASSNEGDIVADFFCGSGTTLAVAKKLNRRWIGCDKSEEAIKITEKRLEAYNTLL